MRAMKHRGGSLVAVKKRAMARGFMCGCGGSKAVSISDGSDKSPIKTPPPATVTTTTTTRTTSLPTAPSSSSSSSYYIDTDADASAAGTPSMTALLRQLSELEKGVRALGIANKDAGGGCRSGRHRRSVSEGGGGGAGRVEESVAVVKQSADPLGDFRRSMLQMIVEKEIVGGAELRELLHRFLALNSPHHHHLILRAFAEIWDEVFAGYDRTPDLLLSHKNTTPRRFTHQEPPYCLFH